MGKLRSQEDLYIPVIIYMSISPHIHIYIYIHWLYPVLWLAETHREKIIIQGWSVCRLPTRCLRISQDFAQQHRAALVWPHDVLFFVGRNHFFGADEIPWNPPIAAQWGVFFRHLCWLNLPCVIANLRELATNLCVSKKSGELHR